MILTGWLQWRDVTAAPLEAGCPRLGPTHEQVHRWQGSAQPSAVKLAMATQISAACFDSAQPEVLVEKRHKWKKMSP